MFWISLSQGYFVRDKHLDWGLLVMIVLVVPGLLIDCVSLSLIMFFYMTHLFFRLLASFTN